MIMDISYLTYSGLPEYGIKQTTYFVFNYFNFTYNIV